MYLGAHVSIAGGFDKCIDRIFHLGGNTLMTFASSPRSLQTKEFTQTEISSYLQKKTDFHIGPHFFHGVYLVNLATDKPDYLKVSIDSLIFYQNFAAQIHGQGTIFHLGSHQGRGLKTMFTQIIKALDQVLEQTSKGVHLYLENAAGQSGVVGDKLEDLALIINNVHQPEKVKICLDTQHAYASGLKLDSLVDTFDTLIGLDKLGVIHFNNSLVEFNSHRDRHANLSEGTISVETMKKFINDSRLSSVPFILEVPGENHSGPRKQDVDFLKSLVVQ